MTVVEISRPVIIGGHGGSLNSYTAKRGEIMDVHELRVLEHYTSNGKTNIAMIPQYAIPPGEQWSIDFVGVDFERRALLYIEVSSNQRPTERTLDKMRRRQEWIPVVHRRLADASPVIDEKWRDFAVIFVVDRVVESVKRKLDSPTVEPLSRCYPTWITGKPYIPAEPRLAPPNPPLEPTAIVDDG